VAISKEITRLDKSNVALSVTVPQDDVLKQYSEMMKEYTKNLQIPGFRKGKVPQEVLERKFGDALKDDAFGRILESSMEEIFGENNDKLPRNEKPLPYSRPELQEKELKLNLDQALKFTVIYDVLPEVKIGPDQWKGLKVEYSYAEIENDDITRELDEIRERNAVVIDLDEDAAAKKNDVVTIDYEIMEEDGVTPHQISRKDMSFTLDGKNVFKFDDQIIGMKKDQSKEFDKKFDSDFFHVDFAGITRKVRITLTSLKEKQLPALDDDLAQDVDEKFNTLDGKYACYYTGFHDKVRSRKPH
jgi:trigger factor